MCAVAESETESTAEPDTESIAEPTEKPPANPTETLMTEPADGDEDSSYEADEMIEPVSVEAFCWRQNSLPLVPAALRKAIMFLGR